VREDVRGQSCGGWGKLVRISALTWGKLVRNSPAQVGHPGENAWGMLVRNDSSARNTASRICLAISFLYQVNFMITRGRRRCDCMSSNLL